MSTEILIHEPFNAAVVFTDPAKAKEVIATVIDLAKKQLGAADATSAEGRAVIRTVAANVAKSKTFVENERKTFTADLVKQKRAVDKIGGDIWDGLEKVQAEIRKPLTDWEKAEEDRVGAHESALVEIDQLGRFDHEPSCDEVEARIALLGKARRRDWQEFDARAKDIVTTTTAILMAAAKAAEKREHDAAELAALRAEKEKQERAAAHDLIKQEELKAAKLRAERETALATAAAARAKAAAEAEAQHAIYEANARAERAEREKLEAIEAEKRRAAAEKSEIEFVRLQKEDEDRRRAANTAHRSKINNEAKAAFSKLCDGREALAQELVTAIARGEIPHVTISY